MTAVCDVGALLKGLLDMYLEYLIGEVAPLHARDSKTPKMHIIYMLRSMRSMKPNESCKELLNEVILSVALIRMFAQIASLRVALSIAAKICSLY